MARAKRGTGTAIQNRAKKLQSEAEEIARQLAELQARQEQLLRVKEEAENEEILEIVRSANLNADVLRIVVKEYLESLETDGGDYAADSQEDAAPVAEEKERTFEERSRDAPKEVPVLDTGQPERNPNERPAI
jgi:Mg2+ and Co2+ transporter CorA